MKKIFLYLVSIILILTSCSPTITPPPVEKKLDLRKDLKGLFEGKGVVFDYKGDKILSFTISMSAIWQGDNGLIEGIVDFDNGERVERRFSLNFEDESNKYIIKEDKDLKDSAQGFQEGDVATSIYTLLVPYGKSKLAVSAQDKLYKLDDNNFFIKVILRKLGFKMGEVNIFLKKTN